MSKQKANMTCPEDCGHDSYDDCISALQQELAAANRVIADHVCYYRFCSGSLFSQSVCELCKWTLSHSRTK